MDTDALLSLLTFAVDTYTPVGAAFIGLSCVAIWTWRQSKKATLEDPKKEPACGFSAIDRSTLLRVGSEVTEIKQELAELRAFIDGRLR